MPDETQTERKELLERIWLAQARAFAELLEDTPAKELPAAVFNTARPFLSDNGIRLDTLRGDEGYMSAALMDEIAEVVNDSAPVPLPEPDFSEGQGGHHGEQ